MESSRTNAILVLFFGSPFFIGFGLAGWFSLYYVIFSDLTSGETGEPISLILRIFLILLDIPLLIFSFYSISYVIDLLNKIYKPITIKLSLGTREFEFMNHVSNENFVASFNAFSKIRSDLVIIPRADDYFYYYLQTIESNDLVIYLSDGNSHGFDKFDIKKIADYMDLEVNTFTSKMSGIEYSIYRNNELELQKNDPRKKYYLSHK